MSYLDVLTKLNIPNVESPINQILTDQLNQHDRMTDSTFDLQNDPFYQIKKRLESNIKKIESIETRNLNLNRQNFNFKMLKKTLVNRSPSKNAKYKQQNNGDDVPPLKAFKSLGNTIKHQKFDQRDETDREDETKQRTLERCLSQINKIKRTVKQLKQSCKNGNLNSQRSRLLQSNQSRYHTEKKLQTLSSSKQYSYSNYKDLSQRSPNYSQQKYNFSDKKFCWMRNPIKVQEFTIKGANEEDYIQH